MAEVLSSNLNEPISRISDDILEEYLDILRLSGVTNDHVKEVNRALKRWKKYILFRLDKAKSIEYFKKLQQECSLAYYNKQMCQIRKFLRYMRCDWVDDIKLPKSPPYVPKHLCENDIERTLSYFEGNVRIRALVLLGATSGLRSEELYQLTKNDIDIDNRTVYVNHNPLNEHRTKTRKSRVSFFSIGAQYALADLSRSPSPPSRLFPQTTISRKFRHAPIRVKDLRKFFSQDWDRRGGPTSIKKLLMGHSLKGDVDLQHYNAQSEEDLKSIYDNVMVNHTIE